MYRKQNASARGKGRLLVDKVLRFSKSNKGFRRRLFVVEFENCPTMFCCVIQQKNYTGSKIAVVVLRSLNTLFLNRIFTNINIGAHSND